MIQWILHEYQGVNTNISIHYHYSLRYHIIIEYNRKQVAQNLSLYSWGLL